MSLAIFDLDNTLLAGDSDYSWGCFLADKGIVNTSHYLKTNEKFYQAYNNGTLDIHAFLTFALQPLKENEMKNLLAWRDEFMDKIIQPMMLPKAFELIEHHRANQHTLMIITATNRFVTESIAREFGIEHLLATEPEIQNGHFTGAITGIPCFQNGKVERLNYWLAENGDNLEQSWFYSDSHNDIPLLEQVSYPVAVDPDSKLAQYAAEKGWKQISLR